MKKKFLTYTLPRPFFKYNIPIAIQSCYLRDYAKKNGLSFSLPITEIVKKNSYFMFKKFFLKKKINIILTSIFMLPIDNTKLIKKILKDVHPDSSFHFALENLKLKKKNILEWQKNYILINRLSTDYKKLNLNNFLKKITNAN